MHNMSLRELLREDRLTNGEDRSRPGYRALRMYRFGVWRMTISSRLLRAPLSVLYRWMHRRVRNRYGIELHYTANIGRRLLIAHQGAIVIHEHATIGDDCLIRQGVTIGAAGTYSIEDAPVLGDRVSLGAGSMILGRVKIGDDVKVGPNAVVMMNVRAGSMVMAPPARVIPPAKPKAEALAAADDADDAEQKQEVSTGS
jgi:serine O-acetyltransferase